MGNNVKIFRNIKNIIPMWPTPWYPLLGINPKTEEHSLKKIYTYLGPLQHCLQDLETTQEQEQENGWKSCALYTMEYYSAINKRCNFAICGNLDGTKE